MRQSQGLCFRSGFQPFVTHLLGRQEPLKQVEIEKLMMARTRYFGAKIAAGLPMPRAPQKVS